MPTSHRKADADSTRPVATSADRVVRSRRRIVKAGLALVPAVLTLRARPALGQSDDGSGNLSGASDNIDQQEDLQNLQLRSQMGEDESWYRDPLDDNGSWQDSPGDGGDGGSSAGSGTRSTSSGAGLAE